MKVKNYWIIPAIDRATTDREVVNQVFQAIEKVSGYTKGDMASKYRGRDLVEYRHIFCDILHRKTKLILSDIGIELNRDHSTVIHSLGVSKDLYETDKSYKAKYNEIEKQATWV